MEWFATRRAEVAPFALSDGKLYLTRPALRDHYRELLRRTPFLHMKWDKDVDLLGLDVPLYARSDKDVAGWAREYIKTYLPQTFGVLRSAKRLVARSGPKA